MAIPTLTVAVPSATVTLNNSNGGFLNVTNSTITGNIAFHGGGISSVAAFAGGTMTVTNSTIVGNLSSFSGISGGISSDSTGPVISRIRSSL